MTWSPLRTLRIRGSLLLCASLIGAVGCNDFDQPIDGPDATTEAAPGPGVHVLLMPPSDVADVPVPPGAGADIVLRPGSETVALRLYLVRVMVEGDISSYQLQLRYDPDVLAFEGGEVPQGVMGSFNEPEPGRIRIAGVALDGVPEDGALDLSFRLKADRGDTHVVLDVEELTGDLGGTDLTERSVPRRLNIVWGGR